MRSRKTRGGELEEIEKKGSGGGREGGKEGGGERTLSNEYDYLKKCIAGI